MSPTQLAVILETLRYQRELTIHGAEKVTRIGGATVITDIGHRGEYPSANDNHIHGLGVLASVTEELLDDLIAHYRAAGIPRFFVYLSPSEQCDEIERWLLERGLWLRLPQDVLYRLADQPLAMPGSGGIVDGPNKGLDPYDWDVMRYADMPGMYLYGAVTETGYEHHAYGVLYAYHQAAYLGPAGTEAEWRRRGGQTALIAARVTKARELGCKHIFAETYQRILKTSYNNLLKAGFVHAYSSPIYVWEID
ncbi:MAG TPA: hypothetical protein VGK19_21510 [Capsulimonadaceae bacterium]|jgi:GNAT superfamily N-acetyltransferase